MPLDEKSFIPLYHQLSEGLLENIESGEWVPHSLIPSEAELCEEYGVSRGTVRQALARLVQEGLLYRKQGKGTFVAEAKTTQQLSSFHSIVHDMKGRGLKPFSRILQNEKIKPGSHVRKILGLREGEMVYKVIGLKLGEKHPITLETTYLVERFFRGLDKISKEEMIKVPLYDTISEKYMVKITGIQETFEPVLTDEYEAQELQFPPGSLALVVKRITYTTDEVPFEFRTIVVRSEDYKYLVKFIYGADTLDLQL